MFAEKDCQEGDVQTYKDHCAKVSYVVEENTISTRCAGNCACCKEVATAKQGKSFTIADKNYLIESTVSMADGDAVVIKVSDRTWNDGSISANLGIILPTQV